MGVPSFSLAGKLAVVTGARRGIGRAIALGFAGAGADVAVCDLAEGSAELKTVADEIKKLGRRALAVTVDVTRKAEVESMAQKIVKEFGAIDILMNNAGVIFRAPVLEIAEDDWDRLIAVNLKGVFLCSQAVGRRMAEWRRGVILSIASQLAFKALELRSAYCTSKAGVVMLTKSMALELGKSGIRVNAIAPGTTKTELSKALWADPQYMKERNATVPLGGLAEPDDIVGAAIFLASDAAKYITGETIVVNGGEYI